MSSSISRFAGLSAVAGARAASPVSTLRAAQTSFARAAKKLEPVPALAAGARGLAASIGPGTSPSIPEVAKAARGLVDTLETQASTLVGQVRDAVTQGLDLVRDGAEKLDQLGRDLKTVGQGFDRTVKDEFVHGPIDRMQKGDELTLTVNAEIEVGEGVALKGKGEHQVKVKQNDDGTITVRQDTSGTGGVKVGGKWKDTVDVGADATGTGGVTHEYKVAVYKEVDGKQVLDVEATKAEAKKLADALLTPPVENAQIAMVGPNPMKKGRTDDQDKLIAKYHIATEYRGSAANNVMETLGLPNVASESASGKAEAEAKVRVETGADGKTRVTTSVTVAGEGAAEVSGNPEQLKRLADPTHLPENPTDVLNTGSAETKKTSKVTVQQTFELNETPELKKTELVYETDEQVGAGSGKRADVVVASGGGKETNRVGVQTTTTLSLENPTPEEVAKLQQHLQRGELDEAAKQVGTRAKVKIESTVYQERVRTADYKIGLGPVNGGSKVESVERHPLVTTPVVDTNATEVAETVARVNRQMRDRLEPMPRPVMIRG